MKDIHVMVYELFDNDDISIKPKFVGYTLSLKMAEDWLYPNPARAIGKIRFCKLTQKPCSAHCKLIHEVKIVTLEDLKNMDFINE